MTNLYGMILGLAVASSAAGAVGHDYRDAAWGYSLRVPGHWQQISETPPTFALPPEREGERPFRPNLNVVVERIPAGMGLRRYVRLNLETLSAMVGDFVVAGEGPARLGNEAAWEVVYQGRLTAVPLLLKWQAVFAVHRSRGYVVTFTARESTFASQLVKARPLIGSFKFTR